MAISPDGSHAYVPNYADNTVSVIDTVTNTVSTTIAVGKYPGGVVVSPDGSRLYVANFSRSNVSVVSTATNSVIATVPVGPQPVALGNFISSTNGALSYARAS